jgi:hypothetical protein
MKIIVNKFGKKTLVSAIMGNIRLSRSCATFGEYADGRSYYEGTIFSRKGKKLGYFSQAFNVPAREDELVLVFY